MRILCLGLLILCAGCSRQPQPAAAQKEKASAESKILHFYASPGLLASGEIATLCYGVENATAVEINPAVEELKPSFNRCFQVAPRQTTTYTLTATGAGTSTASLVINVSGTAASGKGRASAQKSEMILFFLTSTPSVPAGLPATLCYGVTGAAKVSITPPGPALELSERHCFTVKPTTTTTYTLTAVNKDGTSDTQRLTVAVR